MRRLLLSLSAVALIAGFVAPPHASAQQSIYVFGGGFVPRSADGRGADDVIFRNGDFLTTESTGLPVDIKDFNGGILGGGWTVGLTDFFDAGVDVGFYQRTVTAFYTKFNHPDGTEILQDLKLRIVPVTATIRFLPLGHHGPARPYIGGGVGIFAWRYSEAGEFLANDLTTFRDSFPVKGTSTGPVILGGVMIPLGSAGIGGEIRWQSAKGDVPQSLDFSGTKLDLGGLNYLLTFGFRF